MNPDTITARDAAAIIEDIAVNWRALPPHQEDYWTKELIGMNMTTAVTVLHEIKQQGSEHPPTWVNFRARYQSKANAARAIAETEARIDTPVTDMLADRADESTYVRCCQAYCRQALKPAPDNAILRDILFAGVWPDEPTFETTMRGIARDVDTLDPAFSFAERFATIVNGVNVEPMPMFGRHQRTTPFRRDDWGQDKTVGGGMFHLGCRHWHQPNEACPGAPLETRRTPPQDTERLTARKADLA